VRAGAGSIYTKNTKNDVYYKEVPNQIHATTTAWAGYGSRKAGDAAYKI